MQKASVNYWVDMGIGVAGLASAASGLVLLLPGDVTTGVLGLSYQVWNSVHTWSSLAAVAGVGAHLALHWKWMVVMTRQMFLTPGQRPGSERAPEEVSGDAAGGGLSRRAFLAFGGAATVVVAAMAAGYRALAPSAADESGGVAGAGGGVAGTSGSVACPRGLLDDPYPGRCHHYVDADGDGICDYSVVGSGSNLASSSLGGGFAGGGRRPGFGQP